MDDNSQGWASFVRSFAFVFAGLTASLYLFLLVIDPFDSGYLPTPMPAGIRDDNARTANISRGRDQRFSAAIIGNSRVQSLAPHRLNEKLPFSFVQLTVPGSGPLEQAATITWFARHHARIAALVIGIDSDVCALGDRIIQSHPFPYRLYGGLGPYLTALYSTRAVDYAWRRLRLAGGWLPQSDPTGYSDYEAGRVWNFMPNVSPEAIARPAILATRDAPDLNLPGLSLIFSTLDRLAPDVPVIFVLPPVYLFSLPAGDALKNRAFGACKARLDAYASARPRTRVLDYLADNAATREAQNFMDADHMRMALARPIEDDIVAWLDSQTTSPR